MNSVLFLYIFFASRFVFAYLQPHPIKMPSFLIRHGSSCSSSGNSLLYVGGYFKFRVPDRCTKFKETSVFSACSVFLSTLLNHHHQYPHKLKQHLAKANINFFHILSLNFCIIVRFLWLDCATRRSKTKWSFLIASIFSFQC